MKLFNIALGVISILLFSACHTVNQITGHQPPPQKVETKKTETGTKRGVCKECMKLKKGKKAAETTTTEEKVTTTTSETSTGG